MKRLAVLALLLASPLLASPALAADPPTVRTIEAQPTDLVRIASRPGTVLPLEQAALIAHVTGYVREVKVREGDRVERGGVLATIDVPLMAEDLLRADARLSEAAARVAEARAGAVASTAEVAVRRSALAELEALRALRAAQRDRIENLHRNGAATDEALEDVEGALAIANARAMVATQSVRTAEAAGEASAAGITSAQAGVAVAQAERDRVAAMERYAVIRCPYENGLIVRRRVDPNALVKADITVLFEVLDDSRVRVRASVAERDALHVAPGTALTIVPDALPGRPIAAVLARTGGAISVDTRTLLIEAELDNREHVLLAGNFVRCNIDLVRRTGVLALPSRCIERRGDETYAFVVANGSARRVKIQLGVDDGLLVEIVDGISPGDHVVSSGLADLSDGQEVREQMGEAR